jgi:hypothetical protein
MKQVNYQFKAIICILLFCTLYQVCISQTKVNYPNAIQIDANSIATIKKSGKTVYKISSSGLKNGINSFSLPSGDKVYIEMSSSKMKTVTIANKAGFQTAITRPMGGLVAEFTCSGNICACNGDVDCNRMFSTNVCGSFAVCVDNTCVCVMGI